MTPAPRCLLALALTLMLGACVGNGYRKFYRPEVDAFDAANHVVALPDGEAPELVASSDPVAAVRRLRAAGYVQLGTSAFSGPAGSTQQIVAQARQIGATKVVHCRNYEETVSGSIATPSTTLAPGSWPA